MKKQQMKKMVARFLGRNKAIDDKMADMIAKEVLADGMVSRTEKRFLSGLLKRQRVNQSAQSKLERVLAGGA